MREFDTHKFFYGSLANQNHDEKFASHLFSFSQFFLILSVHVCVFVFSHKIVSVSFLFYLIFWLFVLDILIFKVERFVASVRLKFCHADIYTRW